MSDQAVAWILFWNFLPWFLASGGNNLRDVAEPFIKGARKQRRRSSSANGSRDRMFQHF